MVGASPADIMFTSNNTDVVEYEQALADGCFGLAIGLTLHLSQPPPILGSAIVTKVLTEDLVNLTGGKVIVEMNPAVAADKLQQVINEKLAALGIGV